MKPYSKYIEDENFLKWVFDPTEETDAYWEAYQKENPQEKEVISFLKDFLQALKTKGPELTERDKRKLLLQIESRLGKTTLPITKYKALRKLLQYAAVLAIALASGIYFFSGPKNNNEGVVFEGPEEAALDTISETQLILGSGEQVVLRNSKSTVQYSNTGAIVVDQKDTLLRSAPKKMERESFNQLIVPYGKRSTITLSDGSTVHLNSGSKLTFPEAFIGAQRRVYLDGEAFFEVTTNKERPFVVRSMNSDFDIKAVGTKFNVSAYSSDAQMLTVLIEGEVHVGAEHQALATTTILDPGELAAWSGENKVVKVKKVDTYPYISWMDGILLCDSEPLASVAKKLERYYNVRIDFENAQNNQIKIIGKLDLNEEITKTLENVGAAAAIEYKKTNAKTYVIK